MKTEQIMELKRESIEADGFNIPCVIVKPADPLGTVVIVHGYGGCKEETLGLAWRVAEMGFRTCAIDLRGHGEHPLDFDANILSDLETTISYFRTYGDVITIGHSLGGRLSLISTADHKIGISPAIAENFNEQTQNAMREMRDYRVRKPNNLTVFDVLKEIPNVKPDEIEESLIIYGSKDIPEIVSECEEYESQRLPVCQIKEVLHRDSFLYEKSYEILAENLQEWKK